MVWPDGNLTTPTLLQGELPIIYKTFRVHSWYTGQVPVAKHLEGAGVNTSVTAAYLSRFTIALEDSDTSATNGM